MKTASQLVHAAAGAPEVADCAPLAPGALCWLCGGVAARGTELGRWLPDTFTGQAMARAPRSPWVCEACAWVCSRLSPVPGRPPKEGKKLGGNFRNYSHVAEVGVGQIAYRNMSKGEKPALLAWLREPHRGAWFAAIADSGQKHVLPYAPMNPPGARRGWVLFEEVPVQLPAGEPGWKLVDEAARLLTAGASKDEILSGDYGSGAWRRCAGAIRGFEAAWQWKRHGAWFALAIWLAQRDAWRELERNEGTKVPHGLVFPLAVIEAIGRPHGLELVAEEEHPGGPGDFDAIFATVLDARCMMQAAEHFRRWPAPLRRRDRGRPGTWPMVWAGGQGLHNPMPFYEVADLIVVGDAEEPLPVLLALWERHGNTAGFLAAASMVPGVLVPAHHDPREVTIEQAVAQDIGITLREDVVVNTDGTRRVEIARGCQYKCTFCSLGWRTPVRENSAADVIATIGRSPRKVHLQAGDAESHSGIAAIRAALAQHGGRDQGWTGRLDTLLDNPDVEIPGQKKYAFGVEGISHRLRAAVGKGYLTDARLVDDTAAFFRRVAPGSVGRGAWHIIAGLPTERRDEVLDLVRVLSLLDERMRGKPHRNLTLHWQPFQPLPGTPMQWCGAGGGARRLAGYLRGAESQTWVRVRQLVGRTDDVAKVCTVLSRADERGADLLDALADGRVMPERAAAIAGVGWGPLDPDSPLPWDFIRTSYPRATLRRAYDVMMRRLAEAPTETSAEELLREVAR